MYDKAVRLCVGVLVCLALHSAAQPQPPAFPDSYHTIQITKCLTESLFCPKGFVNTSIASHSYYDYKRKTMAAIDGYDINIPTAAYTFDQTLVYEVEDGVLRTEIYYTVPGSSQVKCFYSDLAGAFPSPYTLLNATYKGTIEWNNVDCYHWQTGLEGGFVSYFVSQKDNTFIGGSTPAGSQAFYFMFFEAEALAERVWTMPSVDCVPMFTHVHSPLHPSGSRHFLSVLE